jgi:hypothetical protein
LSYDKGEGCHLEAPFANSYYLRRATTLQL